MHSGNKLTNDKTESTAVTVEVAMLYVLPVEGVAGREGGGQLTAGLAHRHPRQVAARRVKARLLQVGVLHSLRLSNLSWLQAVTAPILPGQTR